MAKQVFLKGTRPVLWARIIIYFIVISGTLLCVLPLINVLAISFSTSATAPEVFLWPKAWSLESYSIMFTRPQLYASMLISLERVALSLIISTPVTVLMAYPLSKSAKSYPTRRFYVAILIFCMLFNGGLVPTFILVADWLQLKNNVLALVLPQAVPIFNVILVMNFFRQLPKELEEAAQVDGATKVQILYKIILPLSLPVIATVAMFTFVTHWNDWFAGLLYMTQVEKYPFQTYMQSTIKAPDIKNMLDLQAYMNVSDKTIKAAQIFVGMIPMIIVYPFVQKFFAQGITLGAVKG